jgi:transcriptional regulator with XRE-family HTH domain
VAIVEQRFSGKRLWEAREKRELSRRLVSIVVGVSEQSVSNWEHDVCAPRADRVGMLASYLGISIDDLYEAVEESV